MREGHLMKRVVSAIAPVLLLGCGVSSPKSSDVKDMAIKNGQSTDLLWIQNDEVILANCPAGAPPVQKNCVKSKSRKTLDLQAKLIEAIKADKAGPEALLAAEIKKLKDGHPIIAELSTKISETDKKLVGIDQQIKDQLAKIASFQVQIDQEADQLSDLRLQLASVETKLVSVPSEPTLVKLRLRLLEEIDQKDELVNELFTDQQSVKNELGKSEQRKKEAQQKRSDFEREQKFQWDTLTVSSSLTDQLQGQIDGLNEELAAVPGLFKLISDQGIAYREEDADDVQLRLLKRIKEILARPAFAKFSENFDKGMPIAPFSFKSSNSYGRIQVVNGRLRMDVNTDPYALNEMIVRLDASGAEKLWLSFYHEAFGDEMESIPVHFTGSANGDGVSISNDGNKWYRIVDATALGSSGGMNFSINLDQQVDLIRKNYDTKFGYGPSFYLKFQQYDDYAYPTDGREWDNLVVEMK